MMNDPHHRTLVRAYYLWLNGHPGTDEDRFLLAQHQQRMIDNDFQQAMLRHIVGTPEAGDRQVIETVLPHRKAKYEYTREQKDRRNETARLRRLNKSTRSPVPASADGEAVKA